MSEQNLSEMYRNKTLSMSRQLDIDITLCINRFTEENKAKIVEESDRIFDVVADVGGVFIGFADNPIPNLVFEDIIGNEFTHSIYDLSLEDKIYLLEVIEKVS